MAARLTHYRVEELDARDEVLHAREAEASDRDSTPADVTVDASVTARLAELEEATQTLEQQVNHEQRQREQVERERDNLVEQLRDRGAIGSVELAEREARMAKLEAELNDREHRTKKVEKVLTQKELSIDAVRADMMQRTEEIEAAERRLAEVQTAITERETAAATLAAEADEKLAAIDTPSDRASRSSPLRASRPNGPRAVTTTTRAPAPSATTARASATR